MRAVTVTKALTAADDDNIALAQSPLAAGYLTLNGVAASGGVATLDTQRNVLWTSAGDDRTKTITLIGTDDAGAAIKDSITGSNGGTVAFNLNFKTIVSAYISAASAGAIKLGTNTVGSTSWKLLGDTVTPISQDIYMQLVSGAGTATFEYTADPFLQPIGVQSSVALGPNSSNPVALPHPDLQALTASKEGGVTWPIHGWRLTVSAGTGSWKCTTRQAGLASP